MKRLAQLLGSLQLAVPLLVAIAGVLAWGTIYESRFGTAAVQRFVYHAWWFQALLGFLAVNLTAAAMERYPWQRRHTPFVLAHIGIILVLIGGILGGRFGVEGQLIIPEGQAEKMLQLPQNVLTIRQPNPGIERVIPTEFETQAWVHEPHVVFPVMFEGRAMRFTVDRYCPDAVIDEAIREEGTVENPAVHLLLEDHEQHDDTWLFARDPERFGTGWGDAHVLFLEAATTEQMERFTHPARPLAAARGVVTLRLPHRSTSRELSVPDTLPQTVELKGTPYRVTFHDYFPDFAMTDHGLTSRSDEPNNPAVSFTLDGPEGTDAYLLFALHPDFQTMHGLQYKIPAEVRYEHAAARVLPPHAITILRSPSGTLAAVMTGSGADQTVLDHLEIGTRYTHPSLGYQVTVVGYAPHASIEQHITNRGDEVKAEMIHLVAQEGQESAAAWLGLRQPTPLHVGKEPVVVEYHPAQRPLPVTIKLLDFRKKTYPGIDMPSAFESDVELTDPQRGLILMRTIKMNHPLRYRGYSFYQSSYVEGPQETTILSVRNDPGTPFVYAGFLIIILGVVLMFTLNTTSTNESTLHRRRRKHSS